MNESNKNYTNHPDPYEDIIRSEELDPYEKLIHTDFCIKSIKEIIE